MLPFLIIVRNSREPVYENTLSGGVRLHVGILAWLKSSTLSSFKAGEKICCLMFCFCSSLNDPVTDFDSCEKTFWAPDALWRNEICKTFFISAVNSNRLLQSLLFIYLHFFLLLWRILKRLKPLHGQYCKKHLWLLRYWLQGVVLSPCTCSDSHRDPLWAKPHDLSVDFASLQLYDSMKFCTFKQQTRATIFYLFVYFFFLLRCTN